jgi:hypothetical protein
MTASSLWLMSIKVPEASAIELKSLSPTAGWNGELLGGSEYRLADLSRVAFWCKCDWSKECLGGLRWAAENTYLWFIEWLWFLKSQKSGPPPFLNYLGSLIASVLDGLLYRLKACTLGEECSLGEFGNFAVFVDTRISIPFSTTLRNNAGSILRFSFCLKNS